MTDLTTHAPNDHPRDLLTPGMIEALRKTKPWVRFLSIVGYVFVALLVLVAGGVGSYGIYRVTAGSAEGWALIGMSVAYLVMALVYFYPSRFLFRYAGAIGDALTAPAKSRAVEEALRNQKSFWKFAGILTLVMLLLYPIIIIAAFVLPNFWNAR